MDQDPREQLDVLQRLLPDCLLSDQVRIGHSLQRAVRERRGLSLERWIRQAQRSAQARRDRSAVLDHLRYPEALPISAHRDAIVDAIRKHPVVVIAGETGSGKTTQIPKMCLEAGYGFRARVGCTQPRRVAAQAISRRLAEELQVQWGREVGCKIRFSDQSCPETSLKIMTDGILLAEVQRDPLLAEYEVLILDEAHERSLNIDFLLGYLRSLLRKRDDLKLIVTSATIDTERFSEAFDGAPVVSVSGRMFPVVVRYSPLDEHRLEEGEVTTIDAAASAVGRLLSEFSDGDMLVFLPGERDIRECCDILQSVHGGAVEIIPLFGRLSGGDQQRIFSPGARRRVVVATNVAETSLTVPRIRFVVDSGLARMSRYHQATRSKRLPIEPVARSSANQRAGRCGRISDGVCVRLFSEEDYLARPPYIEPEIQRCNLADVILRMKAFRLGEIESFAFVDPPSPRAIQSAYLLLQELGALDEQKSLTGLGRQLARLPVDPTIGRMILEAKHENALVEVLVIAAGLSIQDPREQPAEKRDQAREAHRQFQDARSDFMALLNIWTAYHDTWESLRTQNQLRKFCRSHFLSFMRMREWRDVHAQLVDTLAELGNFPFNQEPANYDTIHRSILTGLWGHIGRRKERNTYRLVGERQAMVFPGSGLFLRGAPPKRQRAKGGDVAQPREDSANRQPEWMVAGELVETTRNYARTIAEIQPAWIIELASHLTKTVHEAPRWDQRLQRVVALERTTLRGLVLRERLVPYLAIDPEETTRIFIRAALVEGGLERRLGFLEHNRQLREKIEIWQTRLPHRVVSDLDEAFFQFYAARLGSVGSAPDLDGQVKRSGNRDFLMAQAADLLGEQAVAFASGSFPDELTVGQQAVSVRYAYAPGEDRDGVTLQLSVPLAEAVDPLQLEWLIPALREDRVAELLRSLPKSLRRPLMPLRQTASEMVAEIDAQASSFLQGMSDWILRRHGLMVPVGAWAVEQLPVHLRPRYEIVGRDRKVLAAGRNLIGLRETLAPSETMESSDAWRTAARRWEKYQLTRWDLGDLPDRWQVSEVGGLPLYAYPGLQVEHGEVHLRIFRKPEDARAATTRGWSRLAELTLNRELAWLRRELKDLRKVGDLYVTLGSVEELTETAWENLRLFLFPAEIPSRLTEAAFADYTGRAVESMEGLGSRFMDQISAILRKRQETLLCEHPLPNMRRQIDSLVPSRFLQWVPFEQLVHLPRYLQALLLRAERAFLNPNRDVERVGRVRPYLEAFAQLKVPSDASPELKGQVQRCRWLLEEFKVSLFAQELKTAEPVSPKRLDREFEVIRRLLAGS